MATLANLDKIVERNMRRVDVKTLLIIERMGAAGMDPEWWRKKPRSVLAFKRVLRDLRKTDDIPNIRVNQIYPNWKRRTPQQEE